MNLFVKSFLKRKILYIYVGVIIALLFFCLLQLVTSRSVQELEGGHVFMSEDGNGHVLFDNISLKPGVYQIILRYRTNRDYSGFCILRESLGDRKTLLTNGEHLYAGRAETTFYVWLFQAADELQVVMDYADGCYVETGNLLIRNTGKLWSICFVLVLFAGTLGLGILALFFYHREYGIERKTWLTGFGLVGIALLASISQFGGYMYGGADLTYHLQRIEGVKDSILAGQFPIRIEPEWLYGHGYANGIFYCGALFYLPALLRIAGFTVTTAYNVYCIFLNFATAVIAWYCYGKIFGDNYIGLMCSGCYTVSIMRFYRVALVQATGEGSALTFLPLIFYGVYRIFVENENQGNRGWLPLTLGCTGIIQTHVLTCEITIFILILICMICIKKVFRTQVVTSLSKAGAAVVGLNIWYIVPFLDYYLTQDVRIRHASGRTIQDRGLYISQMFVNFWSDKKIENFKERGLQNVVPLSPGYVGLLSILVFVCIWIWWKAVGRDMSSAVWKAAKLSFVFALITLCMTLQVFPWDTKMGWIAGNIDQQYPVSVSFPGLGNGFSGYVIWMLYVDIPPKEGLISGRHCTCIV